MMTIPKLPEHHLDQEVAHVDGIAERLEAGWLMTAIVLTEDTRTSENNKVMTLFPSEQKRVAELLKEICDDRRTELEKQKPNG